MGTIWDLFERFGTFWGVRLRCAGDGATPRAHFGGTIWDLLENLGEPTLEAQSCSGANPPMVFVVCLSAPSAPLSVCTSPLPPPLPLPPRPAPPLYHPPPVVSFWGPLGRVRGGELCALVSPRTPMTPFGGRRIYGLFPVQSRPSPGSAQAAWNLQFPVHSGPSPGHKCPGLAQSSSVQVEFRPRQQLQTRARKDYLPAMGTPKTNCATSYKPPRLVPRYDAPRL
jgi:hypothetical protein